MAEVATSGFGAGLACVLAGAIVHTDSDLLESYSRDQAPLAPSGQPAAVVVARHVGDIEATLRFARVLDVTLAKEAERVGLYGVGTVKRAYLGSMVGDAEVALMRRIKSSFDPPGILNPGKAS